WLMKGFFFSSRRRHTRFSRDWSSDVCSSDLGPGPLGSRVGPVVGAQVGEEHARRPAGVVAPRLEDDADAGPPVLVGAFGIGSQEIGRASCRERAMDPEVVRVAREVYT